MAVTKEQVTQLFVSTFNRAPLSEGLDYWTSSDFSIEMIAESFFDQEEAQAIYTDGVEMNPISNEEFVIRIFDNLFNRLPAVAGLEYWSDALADGLVSKGAMILAVANGATGDDALILANKTAAGLYHAELGLTGTDFSLENITSSATTLTDAMAEMDSMAPGTTHLLTTGQDGVVSYTGTDTYIARVFDNQNTLQSGDQIVDTSSSDTDTLFAQVGSSQGFAISPYLTNVERVIIEARADGIDSNDNNLQDDFVQIDANEMVGTVEYGTDGSRADVVIEDIRIEDDEVTSALTFSMRDTDPGSNADGADGAVGNDSAEGASLHTYIDANSLRAGVSVTGGAFDIKVIDGVQAVGKPVSGTENLLNDHYNDTFSFQLELNTGGDPITIELQSQAINDATTYNDLVAAFNAALVDGGFSQYDITITNVDTGTFTVTNLDGVAVTGQKINVSTPLGKLTPLDWDSSDDTQPILANVIYTAEITDTPDTSDELISANVILDNVGRGSEGGDLEIGSMSTRSGVEQFDVKVEDSSWLNQMYSTNEALEVVTVETSEVARDAVNGDGVISEGYLMLGAGVNPNDDLIGLRGAEHYLDTTVANAGLVDVRVLNASTFAGDLNVSAVLTHNAVAKYLNPIDSDILGTEAKDDLAFNYTLGTADDILNMTIYQDLFVDSDFTIGINGGAGDDDIQLDLIPGNALVNANWYTSQKANSNLSIDTGAGDDVVRTLGEGDAIIHTGAGNDAVYTDNTGALSNDVLEVQTLTFGAAGDLDTQGQVTVTLSDGQTFTTAGLVTGDSAIAVAAAVNAAMAGAVNVAVADLGNGSIRLTYSDGYALVDDVPNATISNIATDTTVTIANTTQGVNGTSAVAATTETSVITFVDQTPGTNLLTFGDTTTLTFVDTDANGDVDAFEAAQQVAAHAFSGWTVVDSNPSLGTVTVTANTAGVVGAVAPVGANVAAVVDTVVGTDATAFVAGTAEVQTITVTNGVDRAGQVTVGIDVDKSGFVDADELFQISLSVGNEGADVADELAAGINAIAGVSAVTGAAATNLNDVIVTWDVATDGSAVENAADITFMDGAIVSATVVETTKGVEGNTATVTDINGILDVNTSHAIWTANNAGGNNTIDDLTTSAISTFEGIKGQLRIDFTPEVNNSVEGNGVTSAWVDIAYDNDTMTTSSMDIRQAIKTAIANDTELSALLVVKDGPSDTFIIESLIDGVMEAGDLDIEFQAKPVTATEQTRADNADNDQTDANGTDEAAFDATVANAAYAEALALDTASGLLRGEESVAGSSDNTIDAGTGDDVIVLSTSNNSGETIVFSTDNEGGTTTIVYFDDADTAPNGDFLDFTAFLDNTDTTDDGDTAADTAITLGNDAVLDVTNEINITDSSTFTAVAGTALDGVFLVIDSADEHVAEIHDVSSAADGSIASDNIVGTIDLVDVEIAGLTLADFSNFGETAINDGINQKAVVAPVVPVVPVVDVTAPVAVGAAVNGTSLTIGYGEALDAINAPAVTDFSVTVNGVAAAPASVAIAGATVSLTLGTAVASTDVVTVSYTDPTVGNDVNAIQDAAGNDAISLVAQAVTNNTAPTSAFSNVDLGSTDVTATAAAESFIYDFAMVAGRATKAGDGEVVITGFDVANDKLVFNDIGTGSVYTEAQFMALPGVVIAENPFATPAPGNTSIYFDASAGVLGGVTLAGVVDAALTTITVETTA